MTSITKDDLAFIEGNPKRMFQTEQGKRMCSSGLSYLGAAARSAILMTRIVELRDKVDKAVVRDISSQAFELFARVGALSCTLTMIEDKDFDSVKDKLELIFCMSFLQAFDSEENLRRLCKSTMEYYLPNFDAIAMVKAHEEI